MLIPSARADKIRSYQNSLFNNPTESKSERIYVFYLLIRPMLGWLKKELISEYSIEPHEAESELYILCANLFNGFDYNKSSIIPYLSKHIVWKINRLKRKLNKTILKEEPSGLNIISEHEHYTIDEEYYWSVPNILIDDKYITKLFTRSEKYIIMTILSCDNCLTIQGIADMCEINKKTAALRLSDIREVLADWRNKT